MCCECFFDLLPNDTKNALSLLRNHLGILFIPGQIIEQNKLDEVSQTVINREKLINHLSSGYTILIQ